VFKAFRDGFENKKFILMSENKYVRISFAQIGVKIIEKAQGVVNALMS
jgi:hypothetical protein